MGPNESLDSALKRFKKKLENEGIAKEFKERQHFVKPSQIRHEHDRSIQHRNERKRLLADRKGHSKKRKRKDRNKPGEEVRE